MSSADQRLFKPGWIPIHIFKSFSTVQPGCCQELLSLLCWKICTGYPSVSRNNSEHWFINGLEPGYIKDILSKLPYYFPLTSHYLTFQRWDERQLETGQDISSGGPSALQCSSLVASKIAQISGRCLQSFGSQAFNPGLLLSFPLFYGLLQV